MTDRQRLGAFGERVAAARLEAAGMAILSRNIRTPSGEIDILARDGTDLVFVEVRTRRARPGTAVESIDDIKLQRMWQCAIDYCDSAAADPETIRIDIVSIDIGPGGKLGHIEHFRGVEIPD